MTPFRTLLPAILGFATWTRAAQVDFALDLTWQRGAPNGVVREMIFVNDIFPGPPLIMNEGDDVTVSLPVTHSLMLLIRSGNCD